MPDWIQLLSGGCAYEDAPFAEHPADEKRAKEYRKEVRRHNLQPSDVQGHVAEYAHRRGWHPETKEKQLARVMKFVF